MKALCSSMYFGILLTVIAYWVGTKIQKKTGHVLCNNMLLAVLFVVAVLKIFDIPYDAYYQGGGIINSLLGPATACMAVNIYTRWEQLKKNFLPILVGCVVGVVTSLGSILLMCRLFGLDDTMTVSLLPKSVTTPIATAVSSAQGGVASITVAAVIVTGILGNLLAPILVKVFRTKDPVAAGLGIGACSHAIGTARALDMGETQGAMGSLAIGLCGIITAILALPLAAMI